MWTHIFRTLVYHSEKKEKKKGLRFSRVSHSRKKTDPVSRRRTSSSATVISALHASVMLTLLELKRSQRATAHWLEEETLISWWAEHPVGLPINTSGGTIEGNGEGRSGDKKKKKKRSADPRPNTNHRIASKGSGVGGWRGIESLSSGPPLTMVGGVDTSLSVVGLYLCLTSPDLRGWMSWKRCSFSVVQVVPAKRAWYGPQTGLCQWPQSPTLHPSCPPSLFWFISPQACIFHSCLIAATRLWPQRNPGPPVKQQRKVNIKGVKKITVYFSVTIKSPYLFNVAPIHCKKKQKTKLLYVSTFFLTLWQFSWA